MDIKVTVEQPDLTTVIGTYYDGNDEQHGRTLGDAVAHEVYRQLSGAENKDWWNSLKQQVHEQRAAIIREEVMPIVLEAIRGPIPRTNTYGEVTGQTTTLRELIMEEVKRIVTHKAQSMGSGSQLTLLQALVRVEVAETFKKDVVTEVAAAKRMVADEIGATVAAAVREGLRK
jgi:hypothetical protein